jgi:ketosteroid isomerase-like protein
MFILWEESSMNDGDKYDQQELLHTEQAWVQAHRQMDTQMICQILDDDYTHLKADGKLIGKQELVADYSSGDRYWEIAESEPIKVQIMGDVGLLFGKWRGKGQNHGEAFDYSAYFLAVYRKNHDGWRLLADASLA